MPVSSSSLFAYNPLLPLGATTDTHRCGEVVPTEARDVAGIGTKGAEYGDQGLRFPGCPRSSVHLLEVVVDGSGCSKGESFRIQGLSCSDGPVGRDFSSQTTNIYPKNEHFSSTFGRAHQRDVKFSQRIPQTCWHVHRPGAYRRRLCTEERRVRVHRFITLHTCGILRSFFSVSDDQFSAQKALQTVAAGQQAENLLDFDDVPSDQPSGLAATEISTTMPAAANLIAGTSSNPLDDLVSIFGNMGATQPTLAPAAPPNLFGSQPPLQPQQQQDVFGGLGGVASPPQVTSPPPQQAQKQEEDLLGLF